MLNNIEKFPCLSKREKREVSAGCSARINGSEQSYEFYLSRSMNLLTDEEIVKIFEEYLHVSGHMPKNMRLSCKLPMRTENKNIRYIGIIFAFPNELMYEEVVFVEKKQSQ